MACDVRGALDALKEDFDAMRAELGGLRLLLCMIPGPDGRLTGVPPFRTEEVAGSGSVPGDYPTTVLYVAGRRYLPDDSYGLLQEGAVSPPSTARWGLFWYYLRDGLDRFVETAGRGGRLLGELPGDVRSALPFELIDPMALDANPVRWALALFTLGWQQSPEVGLRARRYVVTHDHEWVEIPRNRGERRLLSEQRREVGWLLTSDPADRFASVMGTEVFDASARMCEILAEMLPARRSGPVQKPEGWVKSELYKHAMISPATFDRIREVAGIPAADPGDQARRFDAQDLSNLIRAADRASGKQRWQEAAERWRQLLPPVRTER